MCVCVCVCVFLPVDVYARSSTVDDGVNVSNEDQGLHSLNPISQCVCVPVYRVCVGREFWRDLVL